MSNGIAETFDGHLTPPTLSTINSSAESCWTIWCNRDKWIRRKVEQIEYLDRETATHSISYDIDFAYLRSLRSSLEVGNIIPNNDATLLLPLDVFEERPYMTEGLDSPWSGQICLATRREAAYFKTLLLFSYAAFAGGVSKSLTEHMPDLNDKSILFVFESFLEPPKHTDNNAILQYLGRDVEDDIFISLLTWIQESTFAIVSIPNDHSIGHATITYSFSDRMSQSTRPEGKYARFNAFLDRYGIRSSSLTIPDANSDEELALRLRILVPPGMRVDSVRPIPAVPEYYKVPEIRNYIDCISSRWSGRVVSVYAPAIDPEYTSSAGSGITTYFNLKITMNPKREIFAFPALVASAMSYFIVQILVYYILSRGDSSTNLFSSTQGLAPLTALIPAFSAARIIASQEHETVSFALGLRRVLLGSGAVLSVALSTILAFGAEDGHADWRLRVFLYFCVLGQLLLTLFFLFDITRIQFWRKGKRTNYNHTIITLAFHFFSIWLLVARLNINLLHSLFEDILWLDFTVLLTSSDFMASVILGVQPVPWLFVVRRPLTFFSAKSVL